MAIDGKEDVYFVIMQVTVLNQIIESNRRERRFDRMKSIMPTIWYDKLVELCSVQSCSTNEKLMVLYLDRQLRELGLEYTIDGVGNIIVTKGISNTYPCVVSHMDTVHRFVSEYKLRITKKRELFAESGKNPTGIGGDDKCGIFSCLYFLKVLPIVKVVFFTQEESGCKGSNQISKLFFDDCRYIIQLDRKGSDDFLDTKCNQKTVSHSFSSETGKLKKEYKFKSGEGSITDSVNLWVDGIGISCVNISSGFYHPHTKSEYIKVNELWHSIKFTKEMIRILKPKIYKSVKKEVVYANTTSWIGNKNISLNKWCYTCKELKLESIGKMVLGKFKCYTCLGASILGVSIEYKKCKMCCKYVESNDLRWSTNLKCDACSKCRSSGDDKCICSICNKSMYRKHGHLRGEIFVCYTCYLDEQTEIKKETCCVCSKDTEITLGKYDGEIFTCDYCLIEAQLESREIVVSTERCDACFTQVPISRGFYGDGGGTFKCFDCLKI